MSTSSSVKRPSLALMGAEPWRAAFEYLSHRFTDKPALSSGDGHPVIIFPGLGTDGKSVAPLRKVCESLGYTAFDWGRGYNFGPQGNIDSWMDDLAGHCAELLRDYKQGATLIGWSLGGIYAREIAKLMDRDVRQVITIGTPFNAEVDHTNVGWLYRILSDQTAATDKALTQRLQTPPPVPTTSIYSRTDGIVAWQSCIHAKQNGRVQDVEITGSHIGMGWNPEVIRVVADRLAQRKNAWQPYTKPVFS